MTVKRKAKISVKPHLLVALRSRLHLTRAQFAEKLHVDRITVWRWESGRTTPLPVYLKQIQRIWSFSFGVVVKEDQ